MTMTKDEREKLTEALRPDFDNPMPSPYVFTPNQAAAIIVALQFVLANPCNEMDKLLEHEGLKLEHFRSALKVFST